MGSASSRQDLQNFGGEYVDNDDEQEGRSRILRPPGFAARPLIANTAYPVNNVWEQFLSSATQNRQREAIGHRVPKDDGTLGGYSWRTFQQVTDEVLNLARGLKYYSLPGENYYDDEQYPTARCLRIIGTMTKNVPEWYLMDMAASASKLTMVPLYDALPCDSLAQILQQTRLDTVLCGMSNLDKLLSVAESCVDLATLILPERPSEDMTDRIVEAGLEWVSFEKILEKGRENPDIVLDKAELSDVQTICYTSGTTAMPKGAILTHQNWVAACSAGNYGRIKHSVAVIDRTAVHYSYLPAAHVFEKALYMTVLMEGGRIGLHSGDPLKFLEDVGHLKPTFLITVPRILHRLCYIVNVGMSTLSPNKRKAFEMAVKVKIQRNRKSGAFTDPTLDRIFFHKFVELLGGRARWAVNGGAALDPGLQERIRAIFCMHLLQGYGTTETSAIASMPFGGDWKPGHCGPPFENVEFRLRSVESIGYSTADTPLPRGELQCRGPSIIPGYFLSPDTTKVAFDGKWYNTGDVAIFSQEGKIKVVDRVHSMFKLSNGLFVSPEKTESAYLRAPLIGQILAFAKSDWDNLVAVIVPDAAAATTWCKSTEETQSRSTMASVSDSLEDLCLNPAFIAAVEEQMETAAKLSNLTRHERVVGIHLTSIPFAIENQQLTPSFKVRRKFVVDAYSREMENLAKLQIAT